MKLREILHESITFHPVRKVEQNGQIYISGEEWEEPTRETCWYCDGHGTHDGQTCRACKGTGQIDTTRSTAPELNASNSNAYAILDMLQLPQDDAGVIPYEDLPGLRQRLIAIKNRSLEPYVQQPSTEHPRLVPRTVSQRVVSLQRQGPTVYNSGRSHEQVMRYIDHLLKIIDFAQKHKAMVGWS